MKCSIKQSRAVNGVAEEDQGGAAAGGDTWGEAAAAVGEEWEELLRELPGDLEESALATGALVRRRKVKSAADLLRIVLGYAACDLSLRMLGAWCTLLKLGDLSDVALLSRLRRSRQWLGHLVEQVLARQRQALAGGELPVLKGIRVRLQDATVVTAPGQKGSNWRVHVSMDLGSKRILGVQLTDNKGGESLTRFPLQRGEIVIADRGYNAASSLTSVLPHADFIVRIQWCGVPLLTAAGERFNVVGWLRQCFPTPHAGPEVSEPQVIELELAIPAPAGKQSKRKQSKTAPPQPTAHVRLIACALPPEAAERARKRARKRAYKCGYNASADGIFAVGYFFVLTSLPADAWPPQQVLDFYRCRWQVELLFKRCKSILHLDHLRAFDPELIQTYLLAKLLLVLLIHAHAQPIFDAEQPTEWFEPNPRPLSHWRITTLLFTHLQSAIRGILPLQRIYQFLPALYRCLSHPPRARIDQAKFAKSLILRLA